jgi:hypothetical protein
MIKKTVASVVLHTDDQGNVTVHIGNPLGVLIQVDGIKAQSEEEALEQLAARLGHSLT